MKARICDKLRDRYPIETAWATDDEIEHAWGRSFEWSRIRLGLALNDLVEAVAETKLIQWIARVLRWNSWK